MFSPLTEMIRRSPNHSGKRTHTIDRITPHCFVGQCSLENGLNCFLPTRKKCAPNYVIDKAGRIGGSVDEENRSWCSSSNSNDQRAITIECASDNQSPYTFNEACYDSLVNLCVDICRRYNKNTLLWINNRDTALNYTPRNNEMLLTVHCWFANKACPGPWLMSKMDMLAEQVTGILRHEPYTPKEEKCMVEAQIIKEGSKGNAARSLQILLKGLGFKGKNGKVLTLDGDFGTNSIYALKNYQASQGLTQDGICGTKTWGKILN